MKAEKEEEEQTHRVRASTNLPLLKSCGRGVPLIIHDKGAHPEERKSGKTSGIRMDQDVLHLGLVSTGPSHAA